ncbi:MAG: TrkH family potassium uptake protein [Clostridiales bacterium]|nr:TrkH family potassium uptake protein [Clostridiales bacterium]
MNLSVIRYILCQVMKIEGAFMLLPCVVSLIYGDHEGLWFIAVAAFLLIAGFLGTIKKPKSFTMYLKEGCVATSLSWIIMSLFGALPFWLSGAIPSLTDALFETVSGFTTTGASILNEIETLPKSILFWRSFTHWLGGMGVLVFLLAIIPMSGGSNINLMRAESPGPSVSKLAPKIKTTAKILYLIYLALTTLEVILLLFGHMSLFDSLTLSFGTAGTGGFGVRNDSFASYSPYVQWVVSIFMILFGFNFNFYYFCLLRQFSKAFSMEEVRNYLIIILAAVAVIFVNIINMYESAFSALTHSLFQVSSIISTTGFASTDFDTWPTICKLTLVFLMIVGACAGSTGGGVKVSRVTVLLKSVRKEFSSYIHPKIVRKISMDGRPVEHDVVRSINVYMVTFLSVLIGSVFLVSLDGYDLTTTFTAVLACLDNIGPGLEMVGPTCNYSIMSFFSKYILIFDMLAGRLELFPMLIIFHPRLYMKK